MPEGRLKRCRDANPELNGHWDFRHLKPAGTIDLSGARFIIEPAFLLSEQPEADIAEPDADTPWGV